MGGKGGGRSAGASIAWLHLQRAARKAGRQRRGIALPGTAACPARALTLIQRALALGGGQGLHTHWEAAKRTGLV